MGLESEASRLQFLIRARFTLPCHIAPEYIVSIFRAPVATPSEISAVIVPVIFGSPAST